MASREHNAASAAFARRREASHESSTRPPIKQRARHRPVRVGWAGPSSSTIGRTPVRAVDRRRLCQGRGRDRRDVHSFSESGCLYVATTKKPPSYHRRRQAGAFALRLASLRWDPAPAPEDRRDEPVSMAITGASVRDGSGSLVAVDWRGRADEQSHGGECAGRSAGVGLTCDGPTDAGCGGDQAPLPWGRGAGACVQPRGGAGMPHRHQREPTRHARECFPGKDSSGSRRHWAECFGLRIRPQRASSYRGADDSFRPPVGAESAIALARGRRTNPSGAFI